MTLSKQYREIMDHVKVTEEMSRRVCRNLKEADLSRPRRKRNTALLSVTAAACLAVCVSLTARWAASRMTVPQTSPVLSQSVSRPEAVSSAAALSDRVGFRISEPSVLPFSDASAAYTVYPGSLAQIQYSSASGCLTLRQMPGASDPSGDYTDYGCSEELSIGSVSVLLKGQAEGQYSLALWQADGISYSIHCDVPLTPSAFTAMIGSLSPGK